MYIDVFYHTVINDNEMKGSYWYYNVLPIWKECVLSTQKIWKAWSCLFLQYSVWQLKEIKSNDIIQ